MQAAKYSSGYSLVNDSCAGILVCLECMADRIRPVCRELIGKARELAAQRNEKVYTVKLNADINQISALADEIYRLRPAVILIGGTTLGRLAAARLAVVFGTGVTADCTALDMDEQGNLIQTRPAFGGNIMASILTERTRPQIATVRPGIFKEPEGQMSEVTDAISLEAKSFTQVKRLSSEVLKQQKSLSDYKVLVAAGRGVQKQEDLKMLARLAKLLGGTLAGSRALVEKGWVTSDHQIGLSGNTVKPDCIITCGISGSVQFMAGMKNCERIVAINTDPEARIFDIAHFPICGDLYEIVPELIKKLESESEVMRC